MTEMKAPTRPKAPPANRRGSPEAVEKRRAARRFNDLLAEGARPARDGRTEKKRLRLYRELKEGVAAGGQHLKPIDILVRVQALLDLGEPIGTIKKACRPPRAVAATDDVIDGVRRLHVAYGFSPEAYQFVGIDGPTLRKARVARGGDAKGGVRSTVRRAGADGAGRAA
jgi:hypothetical protein